MVVIRILIVVSLLLNMMCPSQINAQAANYQKKKLKEVTVSTLFSYYQQDGNHSAITGGEGTERLNVYSAMYDRNYKFDSIRNINFGVGFDYISSASTDKIDFKVSSASEHDQRVYMHIGYNQLLPGTGWMLGGQLDLSTESDYFSTGINAFANYTTQAQDFSIGFNLHYFNDDLRWRKNVLKPTRLIYPAELRDTSWFDTYRRSSLNFAISIRQDINRRLSLGIFPGLIYQSGILSTPFHRVYFIDLEKPRVERLPEHRLKIPIGIQLNGFLSSSLVFRAYYQYYRDDFSINAHQLNVDLPIKINSFITITPSVRYYDQSAARFFNTFEKHRSTQEYYTSDYDLSGFHSMKFGLEFKSMSNRKIFKQKWIFDRFAIRYAYYRRSDQLFAHTISTLFDFTKNNTQSY